MPDRETGIRLYFKVFRDPSLSGRKYSCSVPRGETSGTVAVALGPPGAVLERWRSYRQRGVCAASAAIECSATARSVGSPRGSYQRANRCTCCIGSANRGRDLAYTSGMGMAALQHGAEGGGPALVLDPLGRTDATFITWPAAGLLRDCRDGTQLAGHHCVTHCKRPRSR